MDSDVLTVICFVVLLVIIDLLIKNKKPKNWVTWVGVVLTSLSGAGVIADLIAGNLLQKGAEYLTGSFILSFILIALGIYFILRKPKAKEHKSKT